MRNAYQSVLKNYFRDTLIHTRDALELTQAQMAEKLAMDHRSFAKLDHGINCCSAITLALFLIYCCDDPMCFLRELKVALEAENDRVA